MDLKPELETIMFTKISLAVVMAATALVTAQPAAMASDAKVTVRDHRTTVVVVRDHRTGPVVRDHRTASKVRDHRTRIVVRDHREKLMCGDGYERLRRMGYRSIHVVDCQGRHYVYRAIQDDKLFQAGMNAYTGKFNISMLGFAH